MKRHPFDPAPFVAGGILLTVAVIGLLDAATLARVQVGVLIPAVLVTIGGALLLGSLRPRSPRADGDGSAPVSPAR
jgi:hypothetical protein